jgi:hypothetical protein
MTKEIIKSNLINRYTKGAYTDNYIFGFIRKGLVYACVVENADAILGAITFAEKRTSSGWGIRFRPTKEQQEIILAHSKETRVLYSVDFMETEKVNHKGNRGVMFEDVCTLSWGGEQTKANLDFTKGGDIIINGVHYQAKFGCSKGAATFTNEKTLVNLGL